MQTRQFLDFTQMDANFHLASNYNKLAQNAFEIGENISFEGMAKCANIERPFQCVYCNMCFKRRYTLQEHVRIHIGARPYACNVCGKSFTQKSSLSKHVKVQVCKKKFGSL